MASGRTLNLGCGVTDKWGTDKLDWKSYGQKDVKIFDLNSRKPLPYKDKTFDEIRLHYLIQVLLYPQEILEECHRVLKIGGKFSITFPDCESLFYFLFPFRISRSCTQIARSCTCTYEARPCRNSPYNQESCPCLLCA